MDEDQLSQVFAALADPTRRDMVARLAVADATVGQLAEPYAVSIQAVSKHIRVLADAGLVTQTRDAQRRPCHLEAEVYDLMTKWIERYREQAEERYQRLDAVLAELQDDQREALRLRVVCELEYATVAQRLGVSEATARARVSRGLRRLAGALEVTT